SPLRLAAQEDHEIPSLAGFRGRRLVGDDQGRSRGYPGDAIQCVLRNDNPGECGLCATRVPRLRLNLATSCRARPVMRLDRAALRTTAFQRNDAPANGAVTAGPLHV